MYQILQRSIHNSKILLNRLSIRLLLIRASALLLIIVGVNFLDTLTMCFYLQYIQQFTRPRDVIQVMNDWRAHTQLSGKLSYIGVPIPTDKQRANFPHEIMGKLGLVRLEREVYSPQ